MWGSNQPRITICFGERLFGVPGFAGPRPIAAVDTPAEVDIAAGMGIAAEENTAVGEGTVPPTHWKRECAGEKSLQNCLLPDHCYCHCHMAVWAGRRQFAACLGAHLNGGIQNK